MFYKKLRIYPSQEGSPPLFISNLNKTWKRGERSIWLDEGEENESPAGVCLTYHSSLVPPYGCWRGKAIKVGFDACKFQLLTCNQSVFPLPLFDSHVTLKPHPHVSKLHPSPSVSVCAQAEHYRAPAGHRQYPEVRHWTVISFISFSNLQRNRFLIKSLILHPHPPQRICIINNNCSSVF